jgi:hypothetical protein
MRRDDAEQGGGNFREIVLDAQVDSSRQKCESFKETLDMRVVAAVRLQEQAAGDAGILLGKLTPKLAKVDKFAFVVFEQFFAHGLLYLVLAAG